MKTIALTGPYNPATRSAIHQAVPEGYRLIDVPDYEHYEDLKTADYMIIRTLKLKKEDLAGTNVRFVQKWGAGYDMIDVKGISELDIPVAICNGVNATPVAEMAVLHMLALYRNFIAINSKLRNRIWAKDEYSSKSYIINGKTVGIVGLGNIGGKVAKIVSGFGAKVVYSDIREGALALQPDIERLPLEELLAVSDIVTVHVPLTDQTRNMFDAKKFSMMKPTAVFINTARGEVINEADLADALRSGKIAGAGLDALSKEPPEEDWPFYAMENVVYTPHTGGNTADNDINMIKCCMDNISRIDKGEPISARNLINNHLLKNKKREYAI